MLSQRNLVLYFRALYASLLPFVCLPVLWAQQETFVGVQEWLLRGSSAMQQGHAAEAEIDFQHAVDQQPNGEVHLDLGLARPRLGNPNEAEHNLAQAIALQPNLLGALKSRSNHK